MSKDVFEMPQQWRELAERNVEQGRAAYSQFMNAMVQASSMWLGTMPANEMTSSFKAVQERGLRFAKQNADAYFNFTSELAAAKDVQSALAIQAQFMQSQMQACAQQAQELARLTAEAAQRSQVR